MITFMTKMLITFMIMIMTSEPEEEALPNRRHQGFVPQQPDQTGNVIIIILIALFIIIVIII